MASFSSCRYLWCNVFDVFRTLTDDEATVDDVGAVLCLVELVCTIAVCVQLIVCVDGRAHWKEADSRAERREESSNSVYTEMRELVDADSDLLFRHGLTSSQNEYAYQFWDNLVGFGSDGGSVFSGHRNGLRGKLTELKVSAGRPFFHAICMAYKVDLVTNHIQSHFRNLIGTIYATTFRYFGSVQNKKLVEDYRCSCLAAGLTPHPIKKIFEVRWVASELAALTNLLRRGWQCILHVLDHRLANKLDMEDKNKNRRVVFASLRYVMRDPRVFAATLMWKTALQVLAETSKLAQQTSAPITLVWNLLPKLERRIAYDAEWKKRYSDEANEHGLQFSDEGNFKSVPIATLDSYKDWPGVFRLNADIRKGLESSADKSRNSKQLLDNAFQEVIPMKKTVMECEDPEKFKKKMPHVITHYAALDWDTFSPRSMIEDLQTSVREGLVLKSVDDAPIPRRKTKNADSAEYRFDYKMFEAFSEYLVLDVLWNKDLDTVFSVNFKPAVAGSNWMTPADRKITVENSVQSISGLLNTDGDLAAEYMLFMKNLPKCLNRETVLKLAENPAAVWKFVANEVKCWPSPLPLMKQALSFITALPGSTADVERAFSILFHTRNSRRSKMIVETLNDVLMVRLNLFNLENFDPHEFVAHWIRTNHRLLATSRVKDNSAMFKFKQFLDRDHTLLIQDDVLLPSENEDEFADEVVNPNFYLEVEQNEQKRALNHQSDSFLVGDGQPWMYKDVGVKLLDSVESRWFSTYDCMQSVYKSIDILAGHINEMPVKAEFELRFLITAESSKRQKELAQIMEPLKQSNIYFQVIIKFADDAITKMIGDFGTVHFTAVYLNPVTKHLLQIQTRFQHHGSAIAGTDADFEKIR
ncbi:unnamed protein product [Caenorhabditis sp. 36 PRJEB53466]|nr:unnamed protein product [Caenorhabditis sp. 36 PRJEB53466]